jgi:hypothetical protein
MGWWGRKREKRWEFDGHDETNRSVDCKKWESDANYQFLFSDSNNIQRIHIQKDALDWNYLEQKADAFSAHHHSDTMACRKLCQCR